MKDQEGTKASAETMLIRRTCYSCRRPQSHCLCAEVSRVENRTRILILQHPRERTHAFGTVRLAQLSLRQVEVLVGYPSSFERDESLARRLRGYGLLYPGPDAIDLSQVKPRQEPKGLVVLDGTWSQARNMHRDISALHGLPHYAFPAGHSDLVSGFQVRKQPEQHCLSTLEAIAHALRALEPTTLGLGDMLRPFEVMQTRQLKAMKVHSPRSKKRSRVRRGPRLPLVLTEEFDSLVVAYGECSTVGRSKNKRHLLTLGAERPATGERMEVVLKRQAQHEQHLPYMRLSSEEIANAVSESSLRATWQAFFQRGDVVAAWNQGTLDLLRAELPGIEQVLLLKAAYHNLRRARGSLEAVVLREKLLTPLQLDEKQSKFSRTQERLLCAVALAKFLHNHANPLFRDGREA